MRGPGRPLSSNPAEAMTYQTYKGHLTLIPHGWCRGLRALNLPTQMGSSVFHLLHTQDKWQKSLFALGQGDICGPREAKQIISFPNWAKHFWVQISSQGELLSAIKCLFMQEPEGGYKEDCAHTQHDTTGNKTEVKQNYNAWSNFGASMI